MKLAKGFSLIGYAYGEAGRIAGCGDAPRTLRELALIERLTKLGISVSDLGDSAAEAPQIGEASLNMASPAELMTKNLLPTYSACLGLAAKTREALESQTTPLIIGGDHSLSIGSVAAVSNFYQAKGEKIGLIWIDTHADINTPETSPSGGIFGMSVAFLTGQIPGILSSLQKPAPAVSLDKVVYIGLRDLDPGEKTLIKAKNITTFTMKDIDILGLAEVTKRALAVATAGTAGYVASFDLDVCDPPLVPGTGLPVRGGLTYREAHLLLELLAEDQRMLSFELVELNPKLDRDFVTAELAVSLLESVVGKSIL